MIARADGVPIDRSRVVDLLIEGHGVALLEQIIVLEKAERLAAERGLSVTQADVEAEYDRALDNLLGEAGLSESQGLRREAAETLLAEVLAGRNVSRREFMLVTRRNAVLRKILSAELSFDERQLKEEFQRLYGERVEIRHIQLASRAEVDSVLQELKAGADFSELALRRSANPDSRRRGGLLPPFAANDPDVPLQLRQKAFSMEVGERSDPIHVDGWYHLVRLERRLPAESVPFDAVRQEVERSLRARLTDPKMQDLYARLFYEARIEIYDPKLRDLFFEKHASHQSAPPP